MATPRGARHYDLEQRFKDLERKCGDLAARVMMQRKLEVSTGDFPVFGGGSVVVYGGGGVAVNDGGGVAVNDGGNIDVNGTGVIRVWGTGSLGTMTDGEFGVTTLDGSGNAIAPSTLAKPDGFIVDAGSGIGYAAYRVDASTGAAVVTSSVNRTLLGHQTTSSAANARLELSGEILRSTSSRRYKQDIEDAAVDPGAVLRMRGRTWRDRHQVAEDPETQDRYVGFIAEELDELGLRQFVEYDEQGRPDAVQYERLTVALLALVQDQERRLSALEARA